MADDSILPKPPSATELRAELEAMVVGDLFGPAGGESEELTVRTVRERYIVGVLAPSRAGASSLTRHNSECTGEPPDC